MKVFLALVGLTLVEVGLATVSLPTVLMVTLLLALSGLKAGMIAWWFMHLNTHRSKMLLLLLPVPVLTTVVLWVGIR